MINHPFLGLVPHWQQNSTVLGTCDTTVFTSPSPPFRSCSAAARRHSPAGTWGWCHCLRRIPLESEISDWTCPENKWPRVAKSCVAIFIEVQDWKWMMNLKSSQVMDNKQVLLNMIFLIWNKYRRNMFPLSLCFSPAPWYFKREKSPAKLIKL